MKLLITILIASLSATLICHAQPPPQQDTLAAGTDLDEMVVTGTMKLTRRTDSPIPVEVVNYQYFRKNPTPCLFESVGMINGVQPQLNCNVCNTGDIHINGMEGPYTMVLIDGMPIVSSLSTVYGLSGIPNSMVDRVEIVKGPASSLYGSEAMGGIINVITKNPDKAPSASIDYFTTSWLEHSLDLGSKFRWKKASVLTGINYFNYQHPYDKNNDGFTDVTLQNRISVFNKWQFTRNQNREASIAARYVYENRWGGQMNWSKEYRGSDSIYGESIYTRRWEIIGIYQLPVKEKIMLQFSWNRHQQNSWYGIHPFMATQQVSFAQLYWTKSLPRNHDLLLGATYRYTRYDDNTPGTADANGINQPATTPLPGIFVQDEWAITSHHTILTGYRFDHDHIHGNIHSPRIACKYAPNLHHTWRASFGTGFRVVNLFTEDHAALTGAREVVIAEALKPERSYNSNLNYVYKQTFQRTSFSVDVTGFYSYFTNKITGDFDTDPTKIIYRNLNGHAISRGISLNTEASYAMPLKVMAGITWMQVYTIDNSEESKTIKTIQLHAPQWSGNFVATWTFPGNFIIDLTAKWNGHMRLPVLPDDYRPAYSPWFCLANIQLTKKFSNRLELYGGCKNLFNFVPHYALMRAFDPFNKYVNDPVNNPNGYTFETSYNYAPLQGIRAFAGFRYSIR